ncbi:tail protein X [Desulfitobacterium hafniense]|uniref:tail protein X n=1 Tax=Desulfitobacterium hafniense TaxID=49338 RepID=UPI0002FE08DC|nr:tail protein X [Desulfitobacterium hafniense]
MANHFVYTTKKGDTFDILALDAYNEESKAHLIIQANPQYSGVLIFEEGVRLIIPIVETEAAASLPPWKR